MPASDSQPRTYTIYMLRCGDGSLYTGITNSLTNRLASHMRGTGARYTRSRLPVTLCWSKSRQQPTAARKLEYAIKQLTRAQKERLVQGDRALWRRLRNRIL
ncbi:MAG: GIY-YIG nuclease family protein [Nannocystaceae bacterium]